MRTEANSGLPTVSALRHDGTWTPPVHARQLVTTDDAVVALSLSPFEFPDMVPFEAAVLTDHGWDDRGLRFVACTRSAAQQPLMGCWRR